MDADFNKATKADIRAKALELKVHLFFERIELADIEQELSLDLLERMPMFNTDKGDWTMFSRAVLRNKAADMIRERGRVNEVMRDREASLEATLLANDDDEMEFLAYLIPDDAPSDIDALCLKLDVETILAKLPERLQRAAELLKTLTQSEAAAEMGMSRTMFRNQCLIPLKEAFQVLVS